MAYIPRNRYRKGYNQRRACSSSSFDSFFSTTALCKECFGVFSVTYILDGCCPYCGSPGEVNNLVTSRHGRKLLELAFKLSEQMKSKKGQHIVTDEEMYKEDY